MKRNLLESKYGDRLANLRERKGLNEILGDYWVPFLNSLKEGNQIFNGYADLNNKFWSEDLTTFLDQRELHSNVPEGNRIVQFGTADWKYFRNETGMEYYDNNEMNKEGNYLIGIRPEDYVLLCVKGMKVKAEAIVGTRKEKAQDFADKMLQGERFPIPLLDYTKGSFSQEGLHRTIGAMLAGCEYVPCLICLDEYSKFNY